MLFRQSVVPRTVGAACAERRGKQGGPRRTRDARSRVEILLRLEKGKRSLRPAVDKCGTGQLVLQAEVTRPKSVGAAHSGRGVRQPEAPRPLCRPLGAVLLALVLASPAEPTARAAAMCDTAAYSAAARTGVPLEVLRAITRVETGRHRDGALQPWPWTVNMEGAGRWFDSRAALLDYVERHMARGARSFDLGCFQINYRWHGQAFRSVADMTDPRTGALYAARFLADLYAETGDWAEAAGAYHSRTPVHARRYRARFAEVLSGLDRAVAANRPPDAPALSGAPRPGGASRPFPLFAGGGAPGSAGSLVPAGLATARPLFDAGG